MASSYDKQYKVTPDYLREDWMGTMQALHAKSLRKKEPRLGILNPVAALYSNPGLPWVYSGTPEYTNMQAHPLTSIMRCPSLEEGELQSYSSNGIGIGSNGSHDYSFTQALRTLFLGQIGTESSSYGYTIATPLIVEEDPYQSKNRGNRETSWANSDKLA